MNEALYIENTMGRQPFFAKKAPVSRARDSKQDLSKWWPMPDAEISDMDTAAFDTFMTSLDADLNQFVANPALVAGQEYSYLRIGAAVLQFVTSEYLPDFSHKMSAVQSKIAGMREKLNTKDWRKMEKEAQLLIKLGLIASGKASVQVLSGVSSVSAYRPIASSSQASVGIFGFVKSTVNKVLTVTGLKAMVKAFVNAVPGLSRFLSRFAAQRTGQAMHQAGTALAMVNNAIAKYKPRIYSLIQALFKANPSVAKQQGPKTSKKQKNHARNNAWGRP